jgi:hypothetical protein
MDHFCANIIRSELAAISAAPPPDLGAWAFAPANDRVFGAVRTPGAPAEKAPRPSAAASANGRSFAADDGPASPDEWVRRGSARMLRTLAAQL